MWVAIDGTDATGKTTLCHLIRDRLVSLGYNVTIIGEFSDSILGDFLNRIVRERKYFSFSNGDPPLAVAESLCLVADLAAKASQAKYQRGCDLVLSDRGVLSVLGYQFARVSDVYGASVAERTIDQIRELICNLELGPDCHVFLDAGSATLRSRLAKRYGGSVSLSDHAKVLRYQECCKKYLSGSDFCIVIDECENLAGRITEIACKLIN
ncbi:MAG: hypothetical protein R3C18_14010 [Planctomycetaceae bacterium]